MSNAPTVATQVGRGVTTMVARFLVVTPLSFLASVVLARLLLPAEFGTYVTCSVLVMGLGGLFELGLMSVLIQQPEEPGPREMRLLFTVYLAMYGVLAGLLVLVAPWVAPLFNLPPDGPRILQMMAGLLLLNPFGCVSNMLLERRMRFGVVAGVDVATLFIDKGTAIFLALQGFGVWAFVWASLTAVAARMVMVSVAAPWPFGFAWDQALIKKHLAKGAWFQGILLVSLARDNLVTFVAGPAFGPKAVGLLNWGLNLPTIVAGNGITIFQRVTFPAFARLHDEPEARARLLAAGLRGLFMAVLPLLALLPVLADPIVTWVYGEAWRAAIPALGWFTLRMAASAVITPLIGYLNATDRVQLGFRAMLAWIGLEWGLALGLLALWGFTGIAAGAAVGSLAPAIALWWYVGREAPLSPLRLLGPGVAIAAPLALAAWWAAPWIAGLPGLLFVLVALGTAWLAAILAVERARVRAKAAAFLARRRPKPAQQEEEPCAPS